MVGSLSGSHNGGHTCRTECEHFLKYCTQVLQLLHPRLNPCSEQQRSGDPLVIWVFTASALFTVVDKEPSCKKILVDSQGRNHFCMVDVLAVPMATCVTLVEDNRLLFFVSRYNKWVVLCVSLCDELILCSL